MDLNESMWSGAPGALRLARMKVRELKQAGNILSADSVILSAYISTMANVPWYKKMLYFFCALRHAHRLERFSSRLSHNELDVLVQFFLGARRKVSVLPFLFPSKEKMFFLTRLELRRTGEALSTFRAKPHQIALAYMTSAEVCQAFISKNDRMNDVAYMHDCINDALNLKSSIMQEEPRRQAIRQLVRILRKAAELQISSHRSKAYGYLKEALELAQGEANTPHQVKKILMLMHQFELEEENK